MTRIVMFVLGTITALVLLFGYHTSTSGALSTSGVVVQGPAAAGAGQVFTGASADTRWGPVQVRITVDGGKVTDVQVVVYPDENPKDRDINARALPILVREALAAQNADIDVVSGATVTSDGYTRSLQSALDQAGL
ncbi:FMN-binding protein [Actinosynnema sp. NPDC020468]|uniref:FMN-binding protein n=1 Tax=Actinosynnema sp. NPDC020468 TaxID=3154488 RepID=UPI0033C784D2